MVARLGELPLARNRPSSEAIWTPGIPATFCEQRASTGPARSEKAAASRAAKGSRRFIWYPSCSQGRHIGEDSTLAATPCSLQIVVSLQVDPIGRCGAKIARQPQCRIRRDGSLAGKDRRDPVEGHFDVLGQSIGSNAEGLQVMLRKHRAGRGE